MAETLGLAEMLPVAALEMLHEQCHICAYRSGVPIVRQDEHAKDLHIFLEGRHDIRPMPFETPTL